MGIMRSRLSRLVAFSALLIAVSMLPGTVFAQSANRSVPVTPGTQVAAKLVAEPDEIRTCRLHCASTSASAKSVASVAQADARRTACAKKMITGQ